MCGAEDCPRCFPWRIGVPERSYEVTLRREQFQVVKVPCACDEDDAIAKAKDLATPFDWKDSDSQPESDAEALDD